MKKGIIITVGLVIIIVGVVGSIFKTEDSPTIVMEKLVNGKEKPHYYLLLKDDKGGYY